MRRLPAQRLLLLALAAVVATGCRATPPPAEVHATDASIEFPATVTAAAFADGDMGGYHLVVWEGGGAVGQALFRARVTDVSVVDALEGLGAKPGDALGIESWDERDDPDATAPDAVIEGPPIRLEVVVPGRDAPLAPADFLVDPGGRGVDLRFGGHRANIERWHSGCVICLYSCPGSKVGNAAYTVRDFVLGSTHFAVRPGVLPPDGTEVTLRLRLSS